jgi:TRAP-type C4-dicarboxylate transport system substrate-binding protein
MGSAAFSAFMNQQKWDGLAKQDQEAIMGESGEKLAKLSTVWDDLETKDCKRMRSEGKIEMLNASDKMVANLKKAWAFLEDEWVDNANSRHIDGKAALARYKALTAQYSN